MDGGGVFLITGARRSCRTHHFTPVAAAEPTTSPCSSCRACEAASGCEAVVNPKSAFFQVNHIYRIATAAQPDAASQARQLLQVLHVFQVFAKQHCQATGALRNRRIRAPS